MTAPECEYCRGDEASPVVKTIAYEYVDTGLRYSGLACEACADHIESEASDGKTIWQVVITDNKP